MIRQIVSAPSWPPVRYPRLLRMKVRILNLNANQVMIRKLFHVQ